VLERQVGPVDVYGFVELIEPRPNRGQRLTIQVTAMEKREIDAWPYRVRVRTMSENAALQPGDAVHLKGTLSPPPGPALPGDYDFARAAWFQALGAVGYSLSAAEIVAEPFEPPLSLRVIAAVARVRQAIGRRVVEALDIPSLSQCPPTMGISPNPSRPRLLSCRHAPRKPTERDWCRHTRLAATDRDNELILPLEEVSERYAKAGHPRTLRTLQRYCANGHLDAQKVATTLGDKYLVTPQSVARHIAQIEELRSLDTVAADRDQSRLVATSVTVQPAPRAPQPEGTTHDDQSRHMATENREVPRYVERLEREVEQAKDERDSLREQIDRKDKTIDSLIERDRETNILVRGLQEMLTRCSARHSAAKRTTSRELAARLPVVHNSTVQAIWEAILAARLWITSASNWRTPNAISRSLAPILSACTDLRRFRISFSPTRN